MITLPYAVEPEPLAVTEQQALIECEAVIERGLATFVEVGQALLAIRDDRLYRASHGTFEDYCRERWGIERRRAYQLMDASEAVANVNRGSQTQPSVLPATERVARPLTTLPAEKQPEVWQRAVDTAPQGKVTAAHVETIVREVVAEEQQRSDAFREGREAFRALAVELKLPAVDPEAESRRIDLLYPFLKTIPLIASMPQPEEVIPSIRSVEEFYLTDLQPALAWLTEFARLWENRS